MQSTKDIEALLSCVLWLPSIPASQHPSLLQNQERYRVTSRCASFQANLMFKKHKLADESLPKRSPSCGNEKFQRSAI
jgi:hypothetical protein